MVRYLPALALLSCASIASAQWSSVGYREGESGTAPEVDEYRLDDGVAENSIGLTNGGSFAWITRYTSNAANPIITDIRAAFGTPLTLNGRPVTAYLWSDPNGDGSPADGVVLASAPGVVSGANAGVPINNPVFVNFDIADTAITPGQNFFVGVVMNDHLAAQFPAAIDQTAPLPGPSITWGAFVTGGGDINPDSLGTGQNLTDFFTLQANGLHGEWLVRATATIPEPASLGMLAAVGVLGLRRRR